MLIICILNNHLSAILNFNLFFPVIYVVENVLTVSPVSCFILTENQRVLILHLVSFCIGKDLLYMAQRHGDSNTCLRYVFVCATRKMHWFVVNGED